MTGNTPGPVDLGVDTVRPAVVTIDLHRGHLDAAVATMPLPEPTAAAVVDANLRFLAAARGAGLPVIHLVTSYRDEVEILSNPWWRSIADSEATRGRLREHQLESGAGVELVRGVLDPRHDRVLSTKKRYDAFLATGLDLVLRSLGVNTLLLTGVNTNSCILSTTIAASTRDYATIVVSDCVATMDDPELHHAALACIEVAFGWVMDSRDALAAVAGSVA